MFRGERTAADNSGNPIWEESESEFEIELVSMTGFVDETLGGIPEPVEHKPSRRIHRFQIEKLARSNVRNWKLRMKDFLRTQCCWEVVQLTEKKREDNSVH